MDRKIVFGIASAVRSSTVALVLLTSLLSCASDPPTSPSAPKDYVVYFQNDTQPTTYYGYHPATGKIDTLLLPYDVRAGNMVCSADGRHLYISLADRIVAVNLRTLQTDAELPYPARAGITPSPDGRYLAINGDDLQLVRLSDHALLYEDTVSRPGTSTFSRDNSRLYYARVDPPNSFFRVDIDCDYAVSEFSVASGLIQQVLPSPDESKIFLYSAHQTVNLFQVYDVHTDSVIFMRSLAHGYGDMDIAPDGRYVFFTEAGDFVGEEGRWYLSVYDVQANRMDRLVPTAGIVDGLNPQALILNEIAATPDGRWLVVSGGKQPTDFVRFNVSEMTFDRYTEMLGTVWLRSFTCQEAL